MVGQHLFNTFFGFVSPTAESQVQVGKPLLVPFTAKDCSNPISMPNSTEENHFDGMDNNASTSSLSAFLLASAVKNSDVIKLMLIGGIIETSRRLVFSLWSQLWTWLVGLCCITVQFDSNDDVHYWMMVWLGNQSIWDSSRNICITSAYSHHTSIHDPDDQDHGRSEPFADQQLQYLPNYGSFNWFNYKGTWISVKRRRRNNESNPIFRSGKQEEILILSWKRALLQEILKEAKDASKSKDVINIYSPGSYDHWSRISSRRKRLLRSVKNGLLADAFEFLSKEEWYIDRGIPYRRGYLLYGVPGSGKTSLIHSIAGELDLDVYIISLSKPGLHDSRLNALFCAMPPWSILLIEDIDAVFRKVTTVRKAIASTWQAEQPALDSDCESLEEMIKEDQRRENENASGDLNNISLSGLLNALDGIAASEGRLLFATTNCISALDEALCRPGRMDVHIKFKNATKWQAKELFRSFFEPRPIRSKDKNENNNHTEKTLDKTNTSIRTPIGFSPAPEPVSLDKLSDQFAESIPVDVFSVASLQGYLMLYKERPHSALKDIEKWVQENEYEKESNREEERAVDG
ncbi:hypothetical protein Clacol_001203 [Clathrus columnatus]|uniref:P-loop containing nucleoside triphosphate hydrolase protein n=1 Tax=Clathrus columnatus TaxID=1419009 RepID=A0AAV4ZYN8_9AGAM|nr:hypothetical protein Clacol_001203 [Clathrus columnatus]